MELKIAIYEFMQDGREMLRANLEGFSTQMNSAVLRAESALFERIHRGANGFIITDASGAEVARWKAGEPKLL